MNKLKTLLTTSESYYEFTKKAFEVAGIKYEVKTSEYTNNLVVRSLESYDQTTIKLTAAFSEKVEGVYYRGCVSNISNNGTGYTFYTTNKEYAARYAADANMAIYGDGQATGEQRQVFEFKGEAQMTITDDSLYTIFKEEVKKGDEYIIKNTSL